MLVSYRDKATFAARQSYLRNKGRYTHVTTAVQSSNPLDFTPRNHRYTRRSPRMDFKVECDQLTCPKVAVVSEGHSTDREDLKPFGTRATDFARHFRGKKPRDSLPDIARCNRGFLRFPFSNPKPHDFRPLDDKAPNMQLGRLLTPDPLNLRLKQRALSGDHNHAYNQTRSLYHRDTGKFITSRTESPKYQTSKYFPKERYHPAFSAHDAFLDRITYTLTHVSQATTSNTPRLGSKESKA